MLRRGAARLPGVRPLWLECLDFLADDVCGPAELLALFDTEHGQGDAGAGAGERAGGEDGEGEGELHLHAQDCELRLSPQSTHLSLEELKQGERQSCIDAVSKEMQARLNPRMESHVCIYRSITPCFVYAVYIHSTACTHAGVLPAS